MHHLRRRLLLGLDCGVKPALHGLRKSSIDYAHPATCPARHFHSCLLFLDGKDAAVRDHATSVHYHEESTSKPSSTKRAISPEAQLLREVNALVGDRDALGAVRLMKSALNGEWPPPRREKDKEEPDVSPSASPSRPPRTPTAVFSSKAFAAALYACDAAGWAAEGLSLVSEVRQHANVVSSSWLRSEHVLFAILRLQCATGDRDGATHMFAFLEQHQLLRLRSASVFLRFCCTSLKDRRLALAVYEKALKHKIELTEPDYVALGVLCVSVHEPISTLFFMLEEMKEHIPEVSTAFVTDVMKPWVSDANHTGSKGEAGKGTAASPPLLYHMEVVEGMGRREVPSPTHCTGKIPLSFAEPKRRADSGSTLADDDSPPRSVTHTRGVCPACHTELSGYPFTSACRAHLLQELRDFVIPQACRSRRALLGFEHWKRYLYARCDSGDRVDVFIDGANLGYYGLSSWYDLAKKELMLHRGVAEDRITAEDLDFNTQCKSSGKGVDVGVNFDLIDRAVRLAVEAHGLNRPLVMLHERHVEPRFMTPQSTAIVQRWRSRGWLYCSPTGLNDDMCWLYGALLMTEPTDAAPLNNDSKSFNGPASSVKSATAAHRTFVCTNDKMRDHHFRLLSPRAFTRWRDRHRIGFRCARVGNQTELYWDLPAPYERCIQRHDFPVQTPTSLLKEGKLADEGGANRAALTWHIPFRKNLADKEDDSIVSAVVEAVEVTPPDTKRKTSDSTQHGSPAEQAESSGGTCADLREENENGSEPRAFADSVTSSPWVCLTVGGRENIFE